MSSFIYRPMLFLFVVLGSMPAVNGDWLYWIDQSDFPNSGVIQRMNLRYQVIETIKTGLHTPTSIVVDPYRHKVYWTENEPDMTGRIFRSNLDGTKTEAIVYGGIATRHLNKAARLWGAIDIFVTGVKRYGDIFVVRD